MLPLSLQSAIYSRYLESVSTTWTLTTLASLQHTTNHEISCHSARQVPCLTLRESTIPVYLAIYGQWLLCHHSYTCTCLDHELRTTWVIKIQCVPTCKSCLLHVYPWRHTHDKMYQALSLLSGKSLGMRLYKNIFSQYCTHSRLGPPSVFVAEVYLPPIYLQFKPP